MRKVLDNGSNILSKTFESPTPVSIPTIEKERVSLKGCGDLKTSAYPFFHMTEEKKKAEKEKEKEKVFLSYCEELKREGYKNILPYENGIDIFARSAYAMIAEKEHFEQEILKEAFYTTNCVVCGNDSDQTTNKKFCVPNVPQITNLLESSYEDLCKHNVTLAYIPLEYPQVMALLENSWLDIVTEKILNMIYAKSNSETSASTNYRLKVHINMTYNYEDIRQDILLSWIKAESNGAILFGFWQVADEIDTTKKVATKWAWKVATKTISSKLYRMKTLSRTTSYISDEEKIGEMESRRNSLNDLMTTRDVELFVLWIHSHCTEKEKEWFIPILYYRLAGYSYNKTAVSIGCSFSTIKKYSDKLVKAFKVYAMGAYSTKKDTKNTKQDKQDKQDTKKSEKIVISYTLRRHKQ